MNDYEVAHIERLRPYLPECCVLLKSKGDFPLDGPSEIALYGSGVRGTIKGGTGSGEVNSRYFDTVEMGFEKAGFTITTKAWLDAYDKVVESAKEQFKKDLKKKAKEAHSNMLMMSMGASMPAPEYNLPLDGAGETAIYVLARESGEGSDRSLEKGEIFLSDTETRDILALNEKYEHFMLVLNVGGPVDLSPIVDQIENILVLSQLGVETGSALASIILGNANPSGKLTTTWAAWDKYNDMEFDGYDDTRYKEGVYVGYRYFDSAKVAPLFPFGYGLSYTSFSYGKAEVTSEKSKVSVQVSVTNTGSMAGKEIVQVYVSVPSGTLDQPYQTLAGYAKTKLLAPGETESLSISFDLPEIASYDANQTAYVLEAGDYLVRVGGSSRDTTISGVIALTDTVCVKKVKHCLGAPDFADYAPEAMKRENYELVKRIVLTKADFDCITVAYNQSYKIDERANALSDDELLHLAMGSFNPKGGLTSMIGNAGTTVAGSAGESAHVNGVKSYLMADGPAGIRIARDYFVDPKKGIRSMSPPMPESMMQFAPGIIKFVMNCMTPKPKKGCEVLHQYCTAIPIGTAIAQSWNDSFAEICGDIVGKEMELFNIDLWLAPALNIHRNIRCGRNFEYYSEDPLISGKMAAAITRGVQAHAGRGVTIKHFAANNQEFNRTSSNSIVSERALREIYLRGFEICVRESAPKSVMSSYNLINGQHTSTRRDLLEDVLRNEFGFEGVVMTDWVIAGGMIPRDAKHDSPHPADVAAAGGDLFMPGSKGDFAQLKEGFEKGRVSREQLVINASRIMNLFN